MLKAKAVKGEEHAGRAIVGLIHTSQPLELTAVALHCTVS